MKKIEAIIRKIKFDDVKEALHEAGIEFFSFWDVRGIGKSVEERSYRGILYDTSSIERVKLSIIVRDQNLQKTIDAILKSACTGEIGDGKIFIVDVIDAIRIRNGENGDASLYLESSEG
ncbi:P-II family nitrogen regulator [Halosquirtibacter xylanolyticus]|uniref:P-II family nitrogen regulator n=1 Tax=Halosquirtibacter xylanolyticus TaxID=3374599 RepID=UPI003749F707|nr:P-II family nitrogen regulator [Prolixibacteraceae bacterium]